MVLTLACSAICRTNSGRFRSETILATVVSTSPSRSGEERKTVREVEKVEDRGKREGKIRRALRRRREGEKVVKEET